MSYSRRKKYVAETAAEIAETVSPENTMPEPPAIFTTSSDDVTSPYTPGSGNPIRASPIEEEVEPDLIVAF